MNFSRIANAVAALGWFMVCAWLTACSTTPPHQPDVLVEAHAQSPQSKAAQVETAPVLNEQRAKLKSDLAGLGASVSDTPEGSLKMSLSSDSFFDSGSANVRESAGEILDALAEVLNRYPGTSVEIIGHTDASGSDATNLPLSIQRAVGTRDHLIAHQVAADRFTTQGWGAEHPIADNKTAKGRAANRRVEIFITER